MTRRLAPGIVRAMKTALALLAFAFVPLAVAASDPYGPASMEQRPNRGHALREAVKKLRPGMTEDEMDTVLPLDQMLSRGTLILGAGKFDRLEFGGDYELSVAFASGHGLHSATLMHAGKIVAQVGK